MRARGWLLLVLATAAVLLLVGRTVTALAVDYAWYAAMGVPSLFREQVTDTILLQGGTWLVGGLFAWANLHAVRRTILAVAVPSRVANIELTAMVPGRRLASVTAIAALIVSAVLALPMTNWSDLALARHGIPFGEIEGILDRDLGFYVYWLPLEETLYLWALVTVVSLTAIVLVLYALTRPLRLDGRRLAASSHVRRHLSALGAVVLLLLAWSYRLDAFDLLQQGSGPDGLFLRIDHRVTLRMDFVLSYGCAIAAAVLLRTGWVGQLRAALVTVTLVLTAAVGLRHVAPALISRSDLLGDPARRDLDYVASRRLFSRRAYDVDAIRVSTDTAAARDSLTNRAPVADVHRLGAFTSLWDRPGLVHALQGSAGNTPASTRESSPVGLVDAAPVGWTMLDDRLTALMVRRPIAVGQAWRVFVADATRPVLQDSVLDLADAAADAADDARGPWPLVGPGLDGMRRLDARTAPDVPAPSLISLRSRVAHAWALRDAALLDADSLESDAPILVTHRDVRDRVMRLAPVFAQGAEVLPVRHGDRLLWAMQLYVASAHYPLSQRWVIDDQEVGYFKLAATALVDASTGRVQLVPVSRPDPVTRTWMTQLPVLFTPAGALPPGLAGQLPPATESAMAQMRTFLRYGSRLDDAGIRHLPDSALLRGAPAPFEVGDTAHPTLAWAIPVLGAEDQVDGVVVATGGAQRTVWWHPSKASTPPLRWRQIGDLLRVVVDTARIELPARREARVRAGPLQTVMTDRGVLVLQTAQWTRPDGGTVISQVGVTDGNVVGTGPTLVDALAAIGLQSMPGASGRPLTTGLSPREGDAPRLYDAMRRALVRGDWTTFGATFDSLGVALRRPPP